MRNIPICGAAVALVALLHGPAVAQSVCKGLSEAACTAHKACRWVPAREGAQNKSPRRAHCRIDMRKVNEILKKGG